MYIYTPQEKFSLKYPDINLTEYFEFIKENSLPKSIKFETSNHHILPKWAFLEYKRFGQFPWNKAILTHKNHIIAHFMLWNMWRVSSNASPLLLMCKGKDRKSWCKTDILDFSELYQDACKHHGEEVSKRHTGKIVSTETIEKFKQSRIDNGTNKKGMMNCILISTGESVHITTTEYEENKNVLYQHHSANKPAWNSGGTIEKNKNKVNVRSKETGELAHITCDEYKNNKHLYRHTSTGKELEKGFTPAYNKETGVIERISVDEYSANKDKFEHPSKNLHWYNNGDTNLRIKQDETIPDGYIRGRLSDGLVGKKKQTATCPHCNKTGGRANMMRYHFDFCKSIK